MTLTKIHFSRVIKNPPPISLCFIICCLVTSFSLQISPGLSKVLRYNGALGDHYWQLITSIFAHGQAGDIIIGLGMHLAGNVLVIAVFGTLLECLLGSRRFFLLSLATFATHSVWKVMYGGGNGASGVCWAYGLVAVPVLFWEWRREEKQVTKDPVFISMAALLALMLVGLPVFLRVIGLGLWNGTNQAHAISILTGLPFVFLWRKVMGANWRNIQTGLPLDGGHPLLND